MECKYTLPSKTNLLTIFSCPDTPASPRTHHLSFSSNEGLQVSFANVGLWLFQWLH